MQKFADVLNRQKLKIPVKIIVIDFDYSFYKPDMTHLGGIDSMHVYRGILNWKQLAFVLTHTLLEAKFSNCRTFLFLHRLEYTNSWAFEMWRNVCVDIMATIKYLKLKIADENSADYTLLDKVPNGIRMKENFKKVFIF
ncbi:hypothetical protein O9G_003678 [Rozella allomycis CSF55]|uniref:Uncharacterized protein n=1 Tax=Rozella allomycis (strain CSF55) TaxID=988480 RepID=A0A075AZ57_ROZAC|nr:hypothetical protein O9G_003678 [Rozella allomycis CSF55]|eukprot:EPZ35419.1 hypothetical protein O9G_003678 [Rozella allomycis CSF55]